jgi:hypothetical protein
MQTKTTTSLTRAVCLIGLARSDDDQSTIWTLDAKKEVDIAYENRSEWDTLDKERKILDYVDLRYCLGQLQFLIPASEKDIHQQIIEQLVTCIKQIPPIKEFRVKLYEADQLFKKNPEQSRGLYCDALALLKGEEGEDYSIQQIECLMKFAFTYPKKHEQRKKLGLFAKEQVFNIFYSDHKLLYKPGKYTKKDILNFILSSLKGLLILIPETETETQKEIKAKIQECQKELLDQSPPPLSAAPSSNARKVTPGPVGNGSWKLARIFGAIASIALAVVSVVALYRRYIIKIR